MDGHYHNNIEPVNSTDRRDILTIFADKIWTIHSLVYGPFRAYKWGGLEGWGSITDYEGGGD